MTKDAYVIVADDDTSEREMIRQVLKKAGITAAIEEHDDGESVIEGARLTYMPHPPSVIILDINMPRMTGFDVLEHFRNDSMLSAIPIIIFSTSDAEAHRGRALSLGAQHYIVKPTDLDDYAMLVTAVREHL